MKKVFLFCLLLITIGYWLVASGYIRAADAYILETPFQGENVPVSGPAEYIRMLFVYGLGIVGIVALFAMVFGGFRYLTSGGAETGKTEGKKWITGAIAGIILLFSSYLILNTINPNLVSLKEPNLPKIEIEPPPPPTQAMLNLGDRTGILPDKLTFDNPKYPNMEQRFNDRAPNDLRQAVNTLPFPVSIASYDEGQHKTNSDHYLGKAIDIYVGNMNDEQLRTTLEYLRNDPNVSKIINGRIPEYNSLNGKSWNYEANDPGINSKHMSHIHISTYGK